jgi:hypothetical protein
MASTNSKDTNRLQGHEALLRDYGILPNSGPRVSMVERKTEAEHRLEIEALSSEIATLRGFIMLFESVFTSEELSASLKLGTIPALYEEGRINTSYADVNKALERLSADMIGIVNTAKKDGEEIFNPRVLGFIKFMEYLNP